MPTGAGKSPTIAAIASDAVTKWGGRVLCLAHRKELLEQNAEKLQYFAPDLKYGIYSAGLKKRETEADVIFAGIQSVYMRAEELGKFDLVIVDEAHLIPAEGEGMYRTFLDVSSSINPEQRVIGFTATPFRMKTGMICTEAGILNEVVYDAPIVPLVNEGFLTRLISRQGVKGGQIDVEGISTVAGEFNLGELELAANKTLLVQESVKEIMQLTAGRKKALIFCSGVAHARAVEAEILHYTHKVNVILGDTGSDDRARRLEHFRHGLVKYIVNVGVFTEGLDVPDIDTIVLLRPTRSVGLYVQMVGRGFRVAPGKENCMILDYGDNVYRHGPIDEIRVTKNKRGDQEVSTTPVKECEQCSTLVHAGFAFCPECGWEFPAREVEIETHASDLDIMDRPPVIAWEDVEAVSYEDWPKRGHPDAPHTLRIDYRISHILSISEWVCIGHPVGEFAWLKAMRWWKKRTQDDMPRTALEAVHYIQDHGIREPAKIKVKYARSRKEFDRIEEYEFRLNTGELLSDINANLKKPEEDIEVPF
jgi:DNA repair protein RadD